MKNFKIQINNILYISKITNVSHKKLRIIVSVVLSNLSVVADILVIIVFSSLISNKISTENLIVEYLVANKKLLPLIVILRFLFMYIEKMNLQSLQLSVRENLRIYLLEEVYKKGNYSLSDATFYINELTTHVSYFYGALTLLISAIIQLIVYGSFLLYSSLNIVLIFLGGGILLFFPTRYFLRLSRKFIHISYEKSLSISNDIQRVVDNIFLIKILKTSESEINKFGKIANDYTKAQLNNYKYGTINSILPNFLTILAFSILIVFFDLLEYLTLEFIGVTLRLVQSLGVFNNSLNALVNSHVHIDKLVNLEQNKRPLKKIEISELENTNLALEVEDVSFSYFNSETKVFENLSLDVYKNKHTVITGANGSGKSTLMGIMTGVLSVDVGRVSCISSKISYVGANPLIIPGTLKDNLLYGNNLNIPDEKIIKELNIFDLPLELNDRISNLTLSSGQMQKISFIRAFLLNIDILFLDESTSNLDESTKRNISKILKTKKLTIVNSTHNPEEFEYDYHIQLKVEEDKRNIIRLV